MTPSELMGCVVFVLAVIGVYIWTAIEFGSEYWDGGGRAERLIFGSAFYAVYIFGVYCALVFGQHEHSWTGIKTWEYPIVIIGGLLTYSCFLIIPALIYLGMTIMAIAMSSHFVIDLVGGIVSLFRKSDFKGTGFDILT